VGGVQREITPSLLPPPLEREYALGAIHYNKKKLWCFMHYPKTRECPKIIISKSGAAGRVNIPAYMSDSKYHQGRGRE